MRNFPRYVEGPKKPRSLGALLWVNTALGEWEEDFAKGEWEEVYTKGEWEEDYTNSEWVEDYTKSE